MRREAVREVLQAAQTPVPSDVLAERLSLPRTVVVDALQELERTAPPPPAFPAGPLCVGGGWLWIS